MITRQMLRLLQICLDATSIEFLDLTELVEPSAQNLSNMFSGAKSLEKIITSGWDTSTVSSFSSMFKDTYAF